MRRSFGKGLSHLITEQMDAATTDADITAIKPNRRQPRSAFDESALAELADSIKVHGVLQPLLVREVKPGQYELIAGERRLRAAKIAGLDRVPIVSRDSTEQESLELALIENLQRADIGPLECARAYRSLIDEFGLTQDKVAQRAGKSRVSITNTLRLLQLPKPILDGLEQALISEGHARALLAIPGAPAQLAMYDRILRLGLSVRDVEAAGQVISKQKDERKAEMDPNWEALQDSVAKRLGAPVDIQRGRGGKGKLVVEFYSDDDLDRILAAMGFSS